ncbi:unnamed protein product [Mytilus coruscus]|uniref:Reverse transcriptase/retrotransposon-derived protein RNase H-like domain-containing protein n=1 Tax=Mytilus coruscus TaxID=42192 RepID=A0A6J8C118_MYTCO|nr:unnamed protein product [Mytilus coruscus]
MKSPTTKKELERFLGMETYIAKFVPNFSSNTAVLRDLLKKDVPFQWDDNHDKTFKDLKTLITNSPVLRYFNSTKPVKLSVDGLGAVLLQKELPIEYASRALTSSQKNWAQIEKELYAIVFGCERFHHYVYGRTIEKYDINVVYKPEKLMYISDTLSRAYLNEFDNSCDKDINAQVHLLVKHVSVSESKMNKFRGETDCDDTLTELKKTVKDGWPESKCEGADD